MYSAGERGSPKNVIFASRGFGGQRRKRKKRSEEFVMVK
jgi:hypothetical protein